MKFKTLAPVVATAALTLTACGTATATVTTQAVHVTNPSHGDLKVAMDCDAYLDADQVMTQMNALPDSDIKVDDLFGCVWKDHSRVALAVELGDDQAAQTYYEDALHSGNHDKYTRRGRWVFIGSDTMSLVYAADAYSRATKGN